MNVRREIENIQMPKLAFWCMVVGGAELVADQAGKTNTLIMLHIQINTRFRCRGQLWLCAMVL